MIQAALSHSSAFAGPQPRAAQAIQINEINSGVGGTTTPCSSPNWVCTAQEQAGEMKSGLQQGTRFHTCPFQYLTTKRLPCAARNTNGGLSPRATEHTGLTWMQEVARGKESRGKITSVSHQKATQARG